MAPMFFPNCTSKPIRGSNRLMLGTAKGQMSADSRALAVRGSAMACFFHGDP